MTTANDFISNAGRSFQSAARFSYISLILSVSLLTFVKNKTRKWWATPPAYLNIDTVRATPKQSEPRPGIWQDAQRARKSRQHEAWLSDLTLQSLNGPDPGK